MIRHQNADAMVLVSAIMRGIHPLDVHHFEYWLGPWRQNFDDELRLRQNHRKNQEVDLLFVSILWRSFVYLGQSYLNAFSINLV
jgi:hypothetical protein